jgi:hypothetical protein
VQRQSILGELGWLAYFIVLLVVTIYALNAFVNAAFPHHFRSTVANALAAILAAAVFIATRSWASRRGRG